jgi:glycosyltransferase involved in cell wall biosynthesis
MEASVGHDGAVDPSAPPVRVSVVIPCRNGAATLARQLEALSRQDFDGSFEVIVADNESSDDTAGVARGWSDRLPRLQVVSASPPGINVARNTGVRMASGEIVAFCDADDEADPKWLRQLSQAFEQKADLVGGSLDWGPLNPDLPLERRRLQTALQNGLGFLPWPEGCNFAVRREVWEAVGGFDESYRYGGDEVDFAWRVQLAGFRLDSAPTAIMNYSARGGARATFSQSVGYGQSHVKLFSAYRANGMRREPMRTVAGRWWWIILHAPRAVRPGESRLAVLRRSGIAYGRIKASVKRREPYL